MGVISFIKQYLRREHLKVGDWLYDGQKYHKIRKIEMGFFGSGFDKVYIVEDNKYFVAFEIGCNVIVKEPPPILKALID